jgi:hypothetical protein
MADAVEAGDLAEIEASIESLLALVEEPVQVPTEPRSCQVAFGLFLNLLWQVTALTALRPRSLDLVCGPLRRSVIEHALYLVWLADDGDTAVDAMNRALQHTQRKLRRSAGAGGFIPTPEQEATLNGVLSAELPPGPDHLLHIGHLFGRYPLAPAMRALWETETGFSHPSLHVVRLFVADRPDKIVLHDHPRHAALAAATPMACFLALFFGAIALNDLLPGRPWSERLREVANRHGTSAELSQVLCSDR